MLQRNIRKIVRIRIIVVYLNMENKEKAVEIVKDNAPRKQKVSKSYTIKALTSNIEKVIEMGYLDDKERVQARELLKKVTMNYIKELLGTDK